MNAANRAKTRSVPLYRICVHCGQTADLVICKQRDGRRLMVCQDGIRCSRRRMAMAGIRLLDHPKNPETVDG